MCIGIPAQVIAISGEGAMSTATVLLQEAERRVNLALLADDGIVPGDWVLVHAGLAMSKLSEEEAREVIALQREVSELFAGETTEAAP